MHTISVSMQHLKVSIGIEYCNRQAFLLLQHRKLNTDIWEIHSVQFSRSVMSNCLWPHESQHARPPCPSQTPGVYSNSCPLSRWWHPAISSSVIPFSSCPQSLPASGSFPMSQLFAWGGQSVGVSASASILPMNTQDLSPLGWTGWIYLQCFPNITPMSNSVILEGRGQWQCWGSLLVLPRWLLMTRTLRYAWWHSRSYFC